MREREKRKIRERTRQEGEVKRHEKELELVEKEVRNDEGKRGKEN